MVSHSRCGSAGSKTRTRWNSPEMITRMPTRTAITLSEPPGWMVTMMPRTRVTRPMNSVTCQDLDATSAAENSSLSLSSSCIVRAFLPDARQERADQPENREEEAGQTQDPVPLAKAGHRESEQQDQIEDAEPDVPACVHGL